MYSLVNRNISDYINKKEYVTRDGKVLKGLETVVEIPAIGKSTLLGVTEEAIGIFFKEESIGEIEYAVGRYGWTYGASNLNEQQKVYGKTIPAHVGLILLEIPDAGAIPPREFFFPLSTDECKVVKASGCEEILRAGYEYWLRDRYSGVCAGDYVATDTAAYVNLNGSVKTARIYEVMAMRYAFAVDLNAIRI